jgi:hypothetical protein
MPSEQAGKLLRAACEFQGKSLAARESCRKQFRQIEQNEDNIFRILVDGQLGLMAEKMASKVDSTTPAISYQIGISASFIRTHFLVAEFILNGDLVEAIVLIRKQLESLARLHELDSKPLQKLTGKVPNIQNSLKAGTRQMYEELSEVAHFSTPRVTTLLHVAERGELIGPSLLPAHTELGKACIDMEHFVVVYFIAWMIEKLPEWYPGYDNSNDRELLGDTIVLALKSGVLHQPEED